MFFNCNSSQNDKIMDWSKLEAFADDKLNVNEKLKFVLGRVENCQKRRKCWFSTFSPFQTMFSKGFFFKVVKSWDCMVKSYKFSSSKLYPVNLNSPNIKNNLVIGNNLENVI